MTEYKPGDIVVLVKEYTFMGNRHPGRAEIGDEGRVVNPETEWHATYDSADPKRRTIPINWGGGTGVLVDKSFWTDPECIQKVEPSEEEIEQTLESIRRAL